MNVCMYIHVRICTHAAFTHLDTYVYIHMHTCIHIYIYIYMYIPVRTRTTPHSLPGCEMPAVMS